MKRIIKIISVALSIVLISAILPTYTVPVYAAGVNDYIETSKDSVALRNDYGSEHKVVCHVSKKGSVMQILQKEKKKVGLFRYNVWYKVSVNDATVTTAKKTGVYWVFEDNITKHAHMKKQ